MRKIIVITSHYIVDVEPEEEIRALHMLEKHMPIVIEADGHEYVQCYQHRKYKEAV